MSSLEEKIKLADKEIERLLKEAQKQHVERKVGQAQAKEATKLTFESAKTITDLTGSGSKAGANPDNAIVVGHPVTIPMICKQMNHMPTSQNCRLYKGKRIVRSISDIQVGEDTHRHVLFFDVTSCYTLWCFVNNQRFEDAKRAIRPEPAPAPKPES